MPTPGSTFRLLAISILLLVTACESTPQPATPASESSPTFAAPSPTPDGMVALQASPQPTATTTPEPPEIDWRTVPIMPEVSQRVYQIYQQGQAQGRDPASFSVIGDCQAIPYVFLGPFGRGALEPGSADAHLWKAIAHFKGSFSRWSVTARGGFTAPSILNPLQADPAQCKPGETPLTCEYRLNNPAFVFITLETWLDPNTIDRYESYLRQILDYVLERGSVPILLTKADAAEIASGAHVINPAIVRVARAYDVPLVNFWRAAQYLPNSGIDPDRDGFHLSQGGYNLKNVLALRALYEVWQAVEQTGSSAQGDAGPASPDSAQTRQAGPASPPQVTRPDCSAGCVFFATAVSHDGLVTPGGVYAYAPASRTLTRVLGEGYDLQDASQDGRRLLVNYASHLYEIDLASGLSSLLSESFYALGRQGAYWDGSDNSIIFLDQAQPFQTETGEAINLFPSARPGEVYFESGACTSKDYCQTGGVYQAGADQSPVRLESFSRLVFSPDGKWVAFLNPAAATRDNYYHINHLFLEEPDRGIASRRVFHFPAEPGFMVYPDVRDYVFSPDGSKLFIIYDVYSAYFENSLRTRTYLIDIRTGILYDLGRVDGVSGALNPRLVWAPEGDKALFFLTDVSEDRRYSINIFQTRLNSDERLVPYHPEILASSDYIYITNVYWR